MREGGIGADNERGFQWLIQETRTIDPSVLPGVRKKLSTLQGSLC